MNYKAKIWADLIKRGDKTIEDVPEELRAEVERYLNPNEE